jgi:thymidylate kinase
MTGLSSLTTLTMSATQSPVPRFPVPLVVELLAAFDEHGIGSCYWKSGRRIREVMSGGSDLDLLIAREHQHQARRILLECGFKPFPSVPARDHPAIASFLGYDDPTGAIIHVHAHFRLVTGGKLLNEYRLPWETVLLGHAVADPALPIRVLDPASEAVLLVVRGCLELTRSDFVVLRNWRRLVEKFERDRQDIATRVDRDAVRARAAEILGNDMADEIADAIFGAVPLHRQRRLRRRMRRALAERRAYNAPEAFLRNLSRGLAWAAGGVNSRVAHLPRPWSRRAAGGGCLVAVLGVDGSGKSTVVRSLRSWLGAELDVMPLYFGTGEGRPSLVLLPFKLLVPFVRRMFPSKPKGASHGRISDRPPGLLYSVLLSMWAALVSQEKRTKLRAAQRAVSRGLIVVTDRYPQDENIHYNDGPLLHRSRWSPDWLRRYEARAYEIAGRMPPDLVIKLDVEPETAARRETDMSPVVIAERIAAVRHLTFPGARVVSVNAEQPLADVLRAVRREVWQML